LQNFEKNVFCKNLDFKLLMNNFEKIINSQKKLHLLLETRDKSVAPILKWVGGKRQLLTEIVNHLPKNIKKYRYFEPFVGGGAVLFSLQPQNAVINDFNDELINVYHVIKSHVDELIIDLQKHTNDADYFYNIRSCDRTSEFQKLTPIQRASRILYLNKTCFNGLYRVNKAGEFNAPFGRYKNPNIVNESTLIAVNKYLNINDIIIQSGDYAEILKLADSKSFVYLDPPYHPISENSNFTGYVQGGWNDSDQVRLKDVCDQLTRKGVKFLQSNSSSLFIKELYKDYHISTVKAIRAINSNGEDRGAIDEFLIQNYE